MLERLGDEKLLDERYRVTQRGERVLVPVSDAEAAQRLVDGEIQRAELDENPQRTPIDRIRSDLADELDDEQLDALPKSWARLGDVLVFRLSRVLDDVAETVGEAYARVLDVDSVVHREASRGELREPATRLVYGDADTRTVHREHGLDYHFDPLEVMFSPGNARERHRLTDRVAGERIVDLFAGIGYFTLPLADARARVLACEKNPAAARFLAGNLVANDLDDRVRIRVGDCREVAPTGWADRVMMGYFPGTDRFLATALRALGPEGGTVHYHDRVERAEGVDQARQRVLAHPALADREVRIEDARVVKSVGPACVHVALDVEVAP